MGATSLTFAAQMRKKIAQLLGATQRSVVASAPRVAPKPSPADEQAARVAFQEADLDHDGRLTLKEMKDKLRVLAKGFGNEAHLTGTELIAAFEQADRDENDVVSEEEFILFFHQWAAEQRAKVAANAQAGGSQKRNSRLKTGSRSSSEESNVLNEESMKQLALEDLTRAKELMMKVTSVGFDDPHRRALSNLFVEASSGHAHGVHAAGASLHEDSDVGSAEALVEKYEKGRIDRIQLTLEEFRVFAGTIGINGKVMQDNLFRNCRPGSDKLLTFQELLRGIAPILRGDEQAQSAFQFCLYDANGDGRLQARELFSLQKELRTDCALERDIVAFAIGAKTLKGGMKHLTFSSYEEHLAKHGKCGFRQELIEQLDQQK